jgi:hypothetical protein
MSGFRPVTWTGTGSAVVLLFSLPFLLVSAFLASELFVALMETWRARDWVEVPATIEEVDLQRISGSKGSTMFRTVAT